MPRASGSSIGLLLASTLACTPDLVDTRTSLPDLSGSWRLEAEVRPSSLYVVTQGACPFDPMVVELERLADRTYTGRHEGGNMRCSGFDEVTTEWTRLGDTTVVIAPADVDAGVEPCFSFICTGPPSFVVTFDLMEAPWSLTAALSQSRMEGFAQIVVEDSVRFTGSWTFTKVR